MNSRHPDPGALRLVALSGKAVGRIEGCGRLAKPLIQRSVEAARRVPGVSGVFVTTDDERIANACKAFGAA
jgi:3-deoxy-manno-octulosonate cytidylyltransferase (CMP-KDO synthetase)